jgi:hypothetical protein
MTHYVTIVWMAYLIYFWISILALCVAPFSSILISSRSRTSSSTTGDAQNLKVNVVNSCVGCLAGIPDRTTNHGLNIEYLLTVAHHDYGLQEEEADHRRSSLATYLGLVGASSSSLQFCSSLSYARTFKISKFQYSMLVHTKLFSCKLPSRHLVHSPPKTCQRSPAHLLPQYAKP